ncbi:endolytic transglycosylase MltG [soil metagenome]
MEDLTPVVDEREPNEPSPNERTWDEIFNSQPPTSREPSSEPSSEPEPVVAPPRSRRELRERESGSRRTPAEPPHRQERAAQPAGTDEHGIPRGPRKRRRLTWLWVLIGVVVVLGVVATAVYTTFEPQIKSLIGTQEPVDYTGSGTGKVIVTIENGQIGDDVAKTLHRAGVTKTYTAFYSLLLKQSPEVQFKPGSYALKKQMSAKAALKAITDPANKVSTQIVIPEGTTVKGVLAKLAAVSQSTGVSEADLQAAVADYTSYGLPAEAPSLEGYLFPATYNIDPGQTAHQIIQTFVTTMFTHLDADGVAVADRHRILTLAALTQKEGGSSADFLKVARVWDNRIAAGMHLESDATVSYGAGSSSINTTAAQRADKSNPYNTYANAGLPVGPISNPGDAAIKATLNPAEGSWLYFVVVNCSTGETAFSDTFAQHEAAIGQLDDWLKANPGGCN